MIRGVFVSGIDTEIGKTVVSALLVKAFADRFGAAAYWKPVQAGNLSQSDSLTVAKLVPEARLYPEAYVLSHAESPHAAAKKEGINIDIEQIALPTAAIHNADTPLVIEGAGGLLSPVNDRFHMIDLIPRFGLDCVLVTNNYLGSINHTLLSIEALKHRKLPLAGLIVVGERNADSEDHIREVSGARCLARIPPAAGEVTADFISQTAELLYSAVDLLCTPKPQPCRSFA